jgi:tetratricopeptide (TPR) repeat protein
MSIHLIGVCVATARLLGWFYRYATTAWRLLVVLLGATALFVWTMERVMQRPPGTWFNMGGVLAVYVFLWLLLWAWQARKRTVIEEFAEYTGRDPKASALGVSTLLVSEITRLRALYRAVDEKRVITTTTYTAQQPIDATIKVDDVSDFLKGAVSSESELSIGWLKVPLGTLMALIGLFVRGPRITGSLHMKDEQLILVAQMEGGKRAYNWRVDDPTPIATADKSKARDVHDLVAELACRIFTDLTLSGSTSWRATWHFTEALRAYRDCLRTPKEKKMKLERAQDRLLRTLRADSKFDLAHYNLGVVYTEMGEDASAELAFSTAIKKDPRRWEAYYALAVNRFNKRDYDSVLTLANRVIQLRPHGAEAYDLKGIAQRLQVKTDLDGAIKTRRKAVFNAVWALCLAQFKRLDTVANDTAPDVTVTAECLLHLAVGYMYRAQLEKEQIEQEFRAEPEFRNEQVYRAKLEGMRRRNLWQAVASLKQAKSLTPSDVRLSFHLGQVYLFLWDWPGPATKALESALVISPTRVDIAACLALAAAQANIPDVARKAAKCVMERASAALDYNDALANVGRAYETIAEARASSPIQAVSEQAARDSKQAERAKDFRAFRNSIDELLSEQGEAGFESLKKMLSNYKNEKWRLECGHLLAALGTILLKSQLEKAEQTEGLLRNAIEILAKNQPEIDRLGLYRELIHSLRFQERYADAIREAEVAISR